MHDLIHDLAQRVAGFEYSIVNDDAADISERVIHASVNLEEFPASLVNARKLRTLSLASTKDFDKIASTFKCLRVLSLGMFRCSGSSDALNFMGELKHLRYLDLSSSDIETLPNSVCELQNLQTLKLNYCRYLTELPRDIKKLVSLRHLENVKCRHLKGMPSGIGQLTSIQTLSLFVLGSGGLSELEGLNNLTGELEIKRLENARDVDGKCWDSRIRDSYPLTWGWDPRLPTPCEGSEFPVTGIPALLTSESRELYLKEKKYLRTLRLYWTTSKTLKYLQGEKYSGNGSAAFLEGLQPNPNLKGLHIWGYGDVRFPSWMVNLGKSLPNLVEITLTLCPSCECFPLFGQLRFLKVLKLSYLNSLEYIGSYNSDSSSSSSSSFKGNILSGGGGWFPALKEVSLFRLFNLKEWTREVVVSNDGGKAKTEAVAEHRKHLLSLNKLANLSITDCPRLTSMPLHPDLEELGLSRINGALIESITTSLLPSFVTLSKLKSLHISYCNDLVSLPEGWLVNLASIEHLKIEYCVELESLSRETFTSPDMQRTLSEEDVMQGFQSLHSLRLTGLPKLKSLPKGFQHATKLKELSITSCGSLVTLLEWMGNIRSLQSLAIRYCKKLTFLPRGMQHLTALEELWILDCPELNFSDEDNDLPGLRSLHSLKLSRLPKLVSLPKVLQHSTTLKNLKIMQCPGLMTLPDWFVNLTSLQQLTISDCNELKSLPEGMRCFTALQELIIWKCPYLSETCGKEIGKDWPKIAHIPDISIDCNEPTFWF